MKNLLGTWSVNVGGEHFEWAFRNDGKTLEHGFVVGSWKIEPSAVRITWLTFLSKGGEHAWDIFHGPIRPAGVQGDSSRGPAMVQALGVSMRSSPR